MSEVVFLSIKLIKRSTRKQCHVGRHQTIPLMLMNKTMKLYVQNTIWLVSPPSSVKQQREMSSFQVLKQAWFYEVKFGEFVNNNGKTPTIL